MDLGFVRWRGEAGGITTVRPKSRPAFMVVSINSLHSACSRFLFKASLIFEPVWVFNNNRVGPPFPGSTEPPTTNSGSEPGVKF